MEILILHPENKEQLSVLKAMAKALKITFETKELSEYSPEFIAKIKKAQNEIKEGKVSRVKKEELQGFVACRY